MHLVAAAAVCTRLLEREQPHAKRCIERPYIKVLAGLGDAYYDFASGAALAGRRPRADCRDDARYGRR